MEFKEFLDTMSGQIRSQKARAVAVREMEDHIRDQADFYESQGMSGGDALKEAVRQMGDPVDVGVELDRIHRPDMEWRLFGWIVAFSGMGLVIQYLCFYCVNVAPGVNGQSQWILGDSTGSFVRQCVYTAVGLGIMAVICLLDYSVIGKYAEVLTICLFAAVVFVCTFDVVRKVNGAYGTLKSLMYLFVPLFGGICYRMRGKGYIGLGICCLWIGAVFFVGGSVIGGGFGVTIDVIAVCLLMVFGAAWRGWFHPDGKRGIRAVFGLGTALAVVAELFFKFGLSPYQIERLQVWLHPEDYADTGGYSIMTIRRIVASLAANGNCFEALEESGLQWFLYSEGNGGDFMILQTAVTLGFLKTVGILVLFGAFFFYLFRMAAREKNRLGRMMGFGCTLMLTVETVRNVLYNFGVGLGSTSGIPFLSFGKVHTLAVYVLLGVLLSIYRYRNLVWEEPVKAGDGGKVKIGGYVIRVEKRVKS